MSSDKLPQGRHLSGVSVVYDVDVRRPGEFQPQLGVRSTITNYDPQPVLGRQIAVNKSYICCGLKQGNIRVLNNHTGLECLLRAHTQRVTDMAFFAEDVHLLASVSVEGRLFVWKISEGLDEGGTPQIKGKIVIAIQIVDEGEAVHPRVCWHCSKQEVLFVGVGKRALRIDTTKVAKCGVPSAEDPIKCPVEKLIDGVQFVGEHDGEVTDLSMCQGMTTTRLVSASMDGTIKIWEDRKSQPLIVLRPYDGLPVYSSIFMTAPNKPDHIILVTVGPLNREVKIWSSATEVLTSDDESWKCTQTLELKSSAQPRVEDAFFNQVIALSQAGLLLLANAKKNAIYAMHIDFGGEPAATQMDYIAEFTVTMPILSFTGTSISPHGEQIVQVYCVQTQAIQQYALDLSKCLPPPLENTDTVDSNTELELQRQIDAMQDEMNRLMNMQRELQERVIRMTTKRTKALKENTDAQRDLVREKISAWVREEISKNKELLRERIQQGIVKSMVKEEVADLGPAVVDEITKAIEWQTKLQEWKKARKDNTDALQARVREEISKNEKLWRERIQQGTVERTDFPVLLDKMVKKEIATLGSAIETKIILAISDCFQKLEKSVNSNLEATVRSQMQLDFQTPGNQARQGDGASMSEPLFQPHYVEEDQEHSGKDVSASATATTTSQLQKPNAKSRKQEWKNMQASCPSSPSPGVLINSVESSNEAGGSSSPPSGEAAVPQIMSMQDIMYKLMEIDREEFQSHIKDAAVINEEMKRLVEEAEYKKKKEEAKHEKKKKIAQDEVSSVLNLPIMFEHPIHLRTPSDLSMAASSSEKDNTNALHAGVREEISKNEKLWRESIQQGTVERTDFPVLLDKLLKKEIAALGSAIETKNILAISDCFQKLEKSVNSNLEATVRSQIQVDFQTPGNQIRQGDGASMSEPLAQLHYVEEDQEQSAKDVSGSATATTTSQLQTPNAKSRKQEWKNMQASGPSSPSLGVLNSVESFNEAGGSLSPPSRQAAVPQRMAMHNLVKQLCDEEREYLQKLRARAATVLDRIKKEEAEKKKKIAKDEVSGSATATTTSQVQTPNAKSRKQEWKNMQASGPSSPSLGVLNSVESFNEAGGSLSPPSREAAVPQHTAMHDLVKQLCDEEREYLKKQRARAATVLDRIKKEEAEKKKKIAKDEVSSVLNPRIMFRHPSHPITPSESLMDASPSESTSTWAANGTGWW